MLGAWNKAEVQVQDQVPVLQGVPQWRGAVLAPQGWGLSREGEPRSPRGWGEFQVHWEEREPH